jgi:hypothetical protein
MLISVNYKPIILLKLDSFQLNSDCTYELNLYVILSDGPVLVIVLVGW